MNGKRFEYATVVISQFTFRVPLLRIEKKLGRSYHNSLLSSAYILHLVGHRH